MLYCLNINLTDEIKLGPIPSTVIQTEFSEIFAVVDTGATANFISKTVVDKLSRNNDTYNIQDLKNNIKVNIANGSPVWVKQIISFNCIIESEEVTIVAFIADWLQRDCILGVPFKEQYKGIAIPIISRKVTLLSYSDYVKVIDGVQARRLLQNSDIHVELYWISTNTTDNKNDRWTARAKEIEDEFSDVIVDELPDKPVLSRNIKHTIDLKPGTAPIARRPYRMNVSDKKELERQLDVLLKTQRIEPSTSPFAAPVLFVTKKDGTKRLCCDFRGLNDATIKSKYPLPKMDELFDQLVGASHFSQLDLVSGYHQVEVDSKDQYKTAFVTHEGQYVWKVMPFGLTNAPSTFQMLMNDTLRGLIGKCVIVYLDDILVYSKSEQEHIQHLREVFGRLRSQGLYAKKSKTKLLQSSIKFLGHRVDKDGIHVDESKVDTIVKWPKPVKPKEALSFVATCSFFRRFIPKFADISNPLYEFANRKLTSWNNDCDVAFNTLKQKLTSAPVLLPFDESKDVLVTTDASDFAVGAVLEHIDSAGRSLGVVAYSSRKLHNSQLRWPTGEKEGFAIWVALMQWSHYLKGRHFILHTDHESLKYLHSKKNSSLKVGRWLDVFAAFDFEIVYIKGERNKADGFSRRPDLKQIKDKLNPTLQNSPSYPSPQNSEDNKTVIPDDFGYDSYLYELSIPNQVTLLTKFRPEYIEELKSGYQQDPDFKVIYNCLINKTPVPHKLDTVIQRYKVIDDLLYHGYTDLTVDKLCIPNNSIRTELLKLAHDSPAGGHSDGFRTFTNLSPHYYWPRMSATIKQYVRHCENCQKSKHRTGKQYNTYTPLTIPEERWRHINIDFISGMTPDKRTKCDNIMVVTCQLTKMSHFIACKKSAKAEEIIQLFFQEIFRLHGMPRVIVSDRDKIFTSTAWTIFTQRSGIKLQMTTSHNPQADGQVERINRILAEKITSVLDPHGSKWLDVLPMVEFAYNNTYQSTIKTTPFLACYGFHPRFVGILNPLESSPRNPTNLQTLPKFALSHVEELVNRAARVKELLTYNIAEEQEYQSKRANAKTLKPDFKIGQKVLIHREVYQKPHAGDKFQFRWYGPFEIVELHPPNAVRLALNQDTAKHDVFNVKNLKHYHNHLNDYGHVPPVGEEEIIKNIDKIAGFNNIYFYDGNVVADVRWKDCEPWDTVRVPVKMLRPKVPTTLYEYWKQHLNRQKDRLDDWIERKRHQKKFKKIKRRRIG